MTDAYVDQLPDFVEEFAADDELVVWNASEADIDLQTQGSRWDHVLAQLDLTFASNANLAAHKAAVPLDHANGSVTLAKLANMPADTIRMRSNSLGVPQDLQIGALPAEPTPVAGDVLLGQKGGNGALVQIDYGSISGGGGTPGGTVEGAIQLRNAAGDGFSAFDNIRVDVGTLVAIAANPTDVPFTVQGTSLQSGSLLEAKDAADATVFSVAADGSTIIQNSPSGVALTLTGRSGTDFTALDFDTGGRVMDYRVQNNAGNFQIFSADSASIAFQISDVTGYCLAGKYSVSRSGQDAGFIASGLISTGDGAPTKDEVLGMHRASNTFYGNYSSWKMYRWESVSPASRTAISLCMAHGSSHGEDVENIVTFRSDSRTGFNNDSPGSIVDIRGDEGAAGILTLSTAELTVVSGDELGRIDFQAPLATPGGDSILVGASIHAEADATFSATVNTTDLVFSTGASETATEKMRLTSAGGLILPALPTADPAIAGALWNNSGVVNISAG